MIGNPCGSWIWLTRRRSGRHSWRVNGNEAKTPWARDANTVAHATSFLLFTCVAMMLHPLLENPLTNLLFDFYPVWRSLKQISASRRVINLGWFGSMSQKPVVLYGAVPWLEDLWGIGRRLEGQRRPYTKDCHHMCWVYRQAGVKKVK